MKSHGGANKRLAVDKIETPGYVRLVTAARFPGYCFPGYFTGSILVASSLG